MSATRKQWLENQKAQLRKNKEQMRLAIAKKKECDKKALTTVEQLLEPTVNYDWLIQNLKFINKCHMEDVIEERAIVRLCGYVLCSKPLTVIIKQQYHISTRRNKVYDVSKRKNFCSSLCYQASNYLLEQMLESPLWLRDKEDIPSFKIFPVNSKSIQNTHGDEIDLRKIISSQDLSNTDNNKKEFTKLNEQIKGDVSLNVSSYKTKDNRLMNNINVENHIKIKEKVRTNQNAEENAGKYQNHGDDYCNRNIEETNIKQDLEVHAIQSNDILNSRKHDKSLKNKSVNIDVHNSDGKIVEPQLDEISNNEDSNSKMSSFQSDSINNSCNINDKTIEMNNSCSKNITISSTSNKEIKVETKIKGNKSKISKNRSCKQKEFDMKTETNICQNLVMRVEKNFREWVTENTLCLLLGKGDEKCQLVENLAQQDRYQLLCKKLNKLQVQEEKEDRIDMEENVLKPLPNLSILREEGKKLDLKVRAFYGGQESYEFSGNSNEKSESNFDPVLPLIDAHTPSALRHRIFLDKLNKILPDLLRALTINVNTHSASQYIYNEKYSLIRLLTNTFNLTASNIVFKTAEWTLVGLIIIKLLSLIDTQLQSILASKQAAMYTSMILTTYKLDSSYLDRLIIEITNM